MFREARKSLRGNMGKISYISGVGNITQMIGYLREKFSPRPVTFRNGQSTAFFQYESYVINLCIIAD